MTNNTDFIEFVHVNSIINAIFAKKEENMIQNQFVNTLIVERIKRNLPDSLVEKLYSFQNNEMRYNYYTYLYGLKQQNINIIEQQQPFCWMRTPSDWNILNEHIRLLSDYKEQRLKSFQSMCCDALDIVNDLFLKKGHESYD